MPKVRAGGVLLHYELTQGPGDPLVLVHGSWGDHHTWDRVVPDLARSFRVVTFDRRGHSQSERSNHQGSAEEDAEDLEALIEALELGPSHVAASSFGGSIALRLAARRQDLFRSVIAHEPPLFAVLEGDAEMAPLVAESRRKMDAVFQDLVAGKTVEGARRFAEEVAFGPGSWDRLSRRYRQTFVENAPTWLDEMKDPHYLDIDLDALATFSRPVLLTQGDTSPPWFPRIIDKLAERLRGARRHTFTGAGHVPHVTHPSEYVDIVTAFVMDATEQGEGREASRVLT